MVQNKLAFNATRSPASNPAGDTARGQSPPRGANAATPLWGAWKTVTVADYERGLVIRDGRFERVLEPGRHVWRDVSNRTGAILFDLRNPVVPGDWGLMLERSPIEEVAALLTAVRPDTDEIALVRVDGQPAAVVPGGRVQHFWAPLRPVGVETVRVEGLGRVDRRMFDAWASLAGRAIAWEMVNHSEAGLVVIDGELVERVGPGRHAYWAFNRTVAVTRVDLRPTAVEVSAQEILTKDRVSVRLTLAAMVQVTDPERLVGSLNDHEGHVYRLVQFAAREAVGGRTLDEMLKERAEVDREIAAGVAERLGDVGLRLGEVRVKDVILPGEMRALMNRVVEAEKAAQANLIRRREETAATRNLLNTARLMDDNPTLMRLKELEALERVTEKIGLIEVRTGQDGLDSVLTNLVRLTDRDAS